MKKNKKNTEGLESRRDFFKHAAKAALPILGAIVFAGAPQVINAAEKEPMGCNYSCSGGCLGSCKYTCSGGCKNACGDGCKYTCSGSCKNSCVGTCRWSSK